jgi:membrane-associated protein
MPWRRFVVWNLLGGAMWSALMVVLGVILGGIPFIVKNIDLLMVLVVIVSVLPLALKAIGAHRATRSSAG